MRELKFRVRQTGYDHEDTNFLIKCKEVGTAPDIDVFMSGQYTGHLTLSQRGARELINALGYLISGNAEQESEE